MPICITGYLRQCIWTTIVCGLVLHINSKLCVVFIVVGEDTKEDMEMRGWNYDSRV